jgi:hypothetical protein
MYSYCTLHQFHQPEADHIMNTEIFSQDSTRETNVEADFFRELASVELVLVGGGDVVVVGQ